MPATVAQHQEGAGLVRPAVVMGQGISRAQAFVDANTRMGLMAMDTFLAANDRELIGEPPELVWMLELIAERPGERDAAMDAFEVRLKQRVRHPNQGRER